MSKSEKEQSATRGATSKLKRFALSAGLTGLLVGMGALHATAADRTHVYWGDLHLHTDFSIDAYSTGNKNVDPDDAYRYARGLPIIGPDGKNVIKIRRPLDFLARRSGSTGRIRTFSRPNGARS